MCGKSIMKALAGSAFIAGWTLLLPACGFTNFSEKSKAQNPTPNLENLKKTISIENIDLKRIDEFARDLEKRWNTPGHFETVMAIPIEEYFPDPREFLTNDPVDFFGYTFEGMLDVLTNDEAIESRLSKLSSFKTVGDYFANDGISSVADLAFSDFDLLVENTIKDFESMRSPNPSEMSDEEINRAISEIDFTSESSVLYLDAAEAIQPKPSLPNMNQDWIAQYADGKVKKTCAEKTQGFDEKVTQDCIDKVMKYSRESCKSIHRDYNDAKSKCDASKKPGADQSSDYNNNRANCITQLYVEGGNQRRLCLNNHF